MRKKDKTLRKPTEPQGPPRLEGCLYQTPGRALWDLVTSMAPNPINLYGLVTYMAPYKFIWFGDIHGPEPYKFIWFGDIHGPKPYKFIVFGDIHGPIPFPLYFAVGGGRSDPQS